MRMCLVVISRIFYAPNSFCALLEKTSRVFTRGFHIQGEVFLNYDLNFKAPFPGCQHGVGERVSLRGAAVTGWRYLNDGILHLSEFVQTSTSKQTVL